MDLRIEAPRQVISEVGGRPPVFRPHEVVVEVERISLCGSDYRLYDGTYGGPKTYPIHFGHEWAGRVVEAPHGSRFSPGELVTGDCSKWCGSCDTCQLDKNLCRHIEKFGITVDGFSRRWRAIEERYLYAGTPGLDGRLLAMAELFAVARHGVRAAESRLRADVPVLIIGAGAVGLATYLILRHELGLTSAVVAEANAGKLANVADRVTGCRLIDNLPFGAWDRSFGYSELMAAAKYPVVFECAGGASALNSALLACEVAGLVVCFGLGAPSVVRTDLIVTKRLAVHGSIGGTGEFAAAIEFLTAHGRSAEQLITHEYAAADAGAAFEQTLACAERIKTQLLF